MSCGNAREQNCFVDPVTKIFFYFFRLKIFFEFSYERRVKTAAGCEAMVWKTSDCIMMDMTAGPGNIVTSQAFPSLMS